MYDEKSRYAKLEPYPVKDRRGRTAAVVPVPPALNETALGIHLLRQGERLDHLAAMYLDNPAGFWRLCELNGVMLAEALSEAREVVIPKKMR